MNCPMPARSAPNLLDTARVARTLLALLLVTPLFLVGCGSDSGLEAGPPPSASYNDSTYESLRRAILAYDELRVLLVADSLEGLQPAGRTAATHIAAAREALAGGDLTLEAFLGEAEAAAGSLAKSGDLASAREAFGELSRALIAVAATDHRLVEGWEAFSCPMTETFPKWIQPEGEIENPYMGQAMPSCGSGADLSVSAPEGAAEVEAHAERVHGVAHYTCSMHPSVRRSQPGTCPICSMDLIAVTEEELQTGTFVVDAARRQEIGVRTDPARLEAVEMRVRAVGEVVYDETRLSEVTVKYQGWIGRLHVDETGVVVKKGAPLFELYSPELYATQQELLAALESQRAARSTAAPERADYLVRAAKERLRLWDLSERQIERVVGGGEPIRYVPVLAPRSGYVIEKNVVEGSTVAPGQTLYRIAGLDRVWVEADVYESELPLVRVGQRAQVSLPYHPGRHFDGSVSFVYPYLEGKTRTGRIRIELSNPELELKPEMYADVELVADRGERLTVPEEAVLYAGERRLVFVDLGEGRLEPRAVETGDRIGERVVVLSGLDAGQVVVTSGNFLIAAESRLKSATAQWQ